MINPVLNNNSVASYETGTFTLTICRSDGSRSVSCGTYNYTKVGRIVHCWGYATYGDITNGANAPASAPCYIQGWPYAANSNNGAKVPISVYDNGINFFGQNQYYLGVNVSTGGTRWQILNLGASGSGTVSGNYMGNGGKLTLDLYYEA